MGNSANKTQRFSESINKADQVLLKANFKKLSKNSDKINFDDLKKSWDLMDPLLLKSIENFLQTINSNINSLDYVSFLKVGVMSVRGNVEDKSNFIFNSIKLPNQPNVEFFSLKKYIVSIIKTYFKVLAEEKNANISSWISKGYSTNAENIESLAEYFIIDAKMEGSNLITCTQLEKWIGKRSTFLIIFQHTFYHFLFKTDMKSESSSQYFPKCDGVNSMVKNPLIDISEILFINSNLPRDLSSKWRFLFSTEVHGESFSTFIGKILNQGPTVLIITDENNDMFGGFAPAGWNFGPQFFGDDTTFLFSLKPNMLHFPVTGYNNHYQYLNLHQQTMPNGLGMGGQFDYWGLWINSEFGLGECSETCTTFEQYRQLSKQKKFKISHLEVWGIGELKVDDEEIDNQSSSILDNAEDRAYLQIAGKTMHSEGFRDAQLEDPDLGK